MAPSGLPTKKHAAREGHQARTTGHQHLDKNEYEDQFHNERAHEDDDENGTEEDSENVNGDLDAEIVSATEECPLCLVSS